MTDFATILKARRQWSIIFKFLKEKGFQTGIPIPPNHTADRNVDKGNFRQKKPQSYLLHAFSGI